MTIFRFPPFCPDQSNFSPEATSGTVNARPTKDGWGPLRSLLAFTDAMPAAPRGAVSVKTSDGSWRVFAGTAANLYELNFSTLAWDEISRTTDDYALPDDVFWRFALFGSTLIATALGSDFPQFLDIEGSSDFANLTNATFEAERVAVVGDFVVFGRVGGDVKKLRWSGINDPTFWTVGQRGSDEQILPDGGEIQEILSQAQNAIVVQSAAIRQMVFDAASGVVFRFITADPERGALSARSIVNIGPNDFAYLAKDGFYRGVQAQPIGAERVDRWFFDNCSSSKTQLVSAAADPFEKIIWWRFEADSGESARIGYDWQLDKWMYTNEDVLDLLSAATGGYTLEDLDDFGTIETLPFSLDSSAWKGGILGFGGFNADFEFGFFDGPNLEALIETEDKALNYPRRAITGNMTPLVDADDSEVAIASKETQDGALTFGPYLTQYPGLPFINSRVSGRWHRFRVKRPAASTWTNAVGIDIVSTDGGAR